MQFETADTEINTTITTQNNATNPNKDQVPNTEKSKAVATIVVVRMPEVSAQLRMTSAIAVDEQDTGEKCASTQQMVDQEDESHKTTTARTTEMATETMAMATTET